MSTPPILLGSCLTLPWQEEQGQIVTDDPQLARFATRDWFRLAVEEKLGTSLKTKPIFSRDAFIPDHALRHPAFLVGATGHGKSRAAEHLLCEQIRRGQSALVLDPKGETVADLLSLSKERGIPPERIVVLSPRTARPPGWNPFASDLPISESVGDVVSVLEKDSRDSWGRRLSNLLTNALLVLASHRLSLHELPRFLSRDDYRLQLLRRTPCFPEGRAYLEAKQFFREEYDQWSRSSRTEASAPVLNKIRGILRNEYLAPLLCAQENTLDLSLLWKEQHLVLVHLDETALGDEGVRLLAGLLTIFLFRTAQRLDATPHLRKNSVVLAMDELASLEHLVGDGLIDICTKSRSMKLHPMVACQHLSQLSEKLKTTLLTNADARIMFRMGSHADAKKVADELTEGEAETVGRCQVSRETGSGARLSLRKQEVYDEHGASLRLVGEEKEALFWSGLFGQKPIEQVYALANAGKVKRLYVIEPVTTAKVELSHFLHGLRAEDYWFETSEKGLLLVIGHPRLKVSNVEHWTKSDSAAQWAKTLMELPIQHCVYKVGGQAPVLVRVTSIKAPGRLQKDDPFLTAAQGASLSEPHIEQLFLLRDREIERVASGDHSPVPSGTKKPTPTKPKIALSLAVPSEALKTESVSENNAGVAPPPEEGTEDDGSFL